MTDGSLAKVAMLSELPDGAPKACETVTGETLCLVKVGGQVFACADRCSHADFPLSDGEMVDDYVIECALHGAQFDVRTGAVLAEPATEPLRLLSVTIAGNDVLVRLPGLQDQV
ncbi:MAG TPA: non-heme iron oxygenase ferredoxin subunit [Gemmatimonadales bacterium]